MRARARYRRSVRVYYDRIFSCEHLENFVSQEIFDSFEIAFEEIELLEFRADRLCQSSANPRTVRTNPMIPKRTRESPDESRECVESSEELETFLRKNLDEYRAPCANLVFSADGYVPAALSRAKG